VTAAGLERAAAGNTHRGDGEVRKAIARFPRSARRSSWSHHALGPARKAPTCQTRTNSSLANLHEVFAERDPDKRTKAIERTYAEDVRFIDPDGEVVGREALNARAQAILDGAPAEFALEEDSPRYLGPDTAAMAWRFGPPGAPVARGLDILTISDGRVAVLTTLIAPAAEA
jgi:hypothetical protein